MKTPTDHALGSPHAPVTLVEFADLESPECSEAAEIVTDLQESFGENLRFVFKHFPLAEEHECAELAAQAIEAAAQQGKFWRMQHEIFLHQDRLSEEFIFEAAERLGMDLDRFEEDLDSDGVFERIEKDIEEGERLGVESTPTFFINGERYSGPTDFEALSTAIQEALDRAQRAA